LKKIPKINVLKRKTTRKESFKKSLILLPPTYPICNEKQIAARKIKAKRYEATNFAVWQR